MSFPISATWGIALAAAHATERSRGRSKRRIVALDWSIVETLLAFQIDPVGIVSVNDYRVWVAEPELPADVLDVGFVLEPNLELIQALAPDLIIGRSDILGGNPRLSKIARVMTVDIYDRSGQPYFLARRETRRLAHALGCDPAGEMLINEVDDVIENARWRLTKYRGMSFYIASLLDPDHVKIFGPESLFGNILDLVGLKNAWQGPTDRWGAASVDIEELGSDSDATLIFMEPIPAAARRLLASNPLWMNLPFKRENRVISLPVVWTFGAVPSAKRFARLLGEVLTVPKADL